MECSLKDKKAIASAPQKILDEYVRKRNKSWVDKGSDFYNTSMKSWSQNNNTEIYSTLDEMKETVVKRIIRTLKNKIYKYMILISKNVYNDKLDDLVDKYNNTCQKIIKMRPI